MNRSDRRAKARMSKKIRAAVKVPMLRLLRDEDLAQPDEVKYAYACWIEDQPTLWREQRGVEQALSDSDVGDLENIEHWGMESYFWNGAPGSRVHPLDAFLLDRGRQLSAAALAQFAGWKQARPGLWEILAARDGVVTLRALDLLTGRPQPDSTVRAIALDIGGATTWAGRIGACAVTYVAPWEGGLHCLMGYAWETRPEAWGLQAAIATRLQRMDLVVRGQDPAWDRRDWQTWLQDRVRFPIQVLVPLQDGGVAVMRADEIIAQSPADAAHMGVYLSCRRERQVVGAGSVKVLDPAHPGADSLVDYHRWRRRVGPPAGVAHARAHMGA